MKKLLAILIILLLVGCTATESQPGNDFSTPPKSAEDTANKETGEDHDFTEKLNSANQHTESVQRVLHAWTEECLLENMFLYGQEDLLALYGIELDRCIDGVGFGDAVGFVQEVLLIQVETEGAKEVMSLMENHLQAIQGQFQGYDPEAYALAKDAVISQRDDLILMAVSPYARELEQIFLSTEF